MAAPEETISGADDPSFQDFAEETQETAEELKDRVRRTGETLKRQAEKETKSRLNLQKERAVQKIEEAAQSLRDTSKSLSEHGQNPLASCVDHAADRLENVSRYLQDRSIGELADDLEYWAQQRPCLFLGGALAAGFMAARFVKASNRH